jgi:CBS domain-containing protein
VTKVKELMTRPVETIGPEATLVEAARRMKELDCGSLPVCEEHDHHIVGMVTDRDITVRAVAQGWDPSRTPVKNVMTPDVICVSEDQDIDEVATLMRTCQVRRVPVVDRDRHVVGLVAIGKLARTEDDKHAGRVLKDVSEPANPKIARE